MLKRRCMKDSRVFIKSFRARLYLSTSLYEGLGLRGLCFMDMLVAPNFCETCCTPIISWSLAYFEILHDVFYVDGKSRRSFSSTSNAVRMSHPDKSSHMSGSFLSASPRAHSSTVNYASLQYQLPTSEVRPIGSGSLSSHFSSAALTRVDRPNLRSSVRPYGSSHPAQLQGVYFEPNEPNETEICDFLCAFELKELRLSCTAGQLSNPVENDTEEGDPATDDRREGDGWIYMTAKNVDARRHRRKKERARASGEKNRDLIRNSICEEKPSREESRSAGAKNRYVCGFCSPT
ncbi:hypothetical protein OROGR_000369 [Orobanche gracilis]